MCPLRCPVSLVLHLEHRQILRPGILMIILSTRGDIRVSKAFLDLGDVRAGVSAVVEAVARVT
jgi:hypothetical protein